MPSIGIHVSSAGGISKTFERAKELQAQCFQFFLRSPRSWQFKGISKEEILAFTELKKKWNYPLMVHAPYLLNLASPDKNLREKSIQVFLEELKICDELRIEFYNFHPGTAKGISDDEGIKLVIDSLEKIFISYKPKNTTVLLENTAGEKGDIGKNLEELGIIISNFPEERIGVCIDTCHAFAYGYDIRDKRGFSQFKLSVEKTIGLERVKAIHANDSKVPLGARKDRHQHLGLGYIGNRGFALFLNDEYFSTLPYYLETPKEGNWDEINLKHLRDLALMTLTL